MMGIASINPATEMLVKTFDALTDQQLTLKIERSHTAFAPYRQTSYEQRRQWLNQAAKILEDDCDRLGHVITLEMGKPIKEAIAEVKKCAWVCRYYADNGAKFLADRPATSDGSQSWICYQPIGTVLAVMPWNFPFWQVFRFAAPALMAGNVALLKHASNVPQCALAIEAIFLNAGFPLDVFQTLLIQAKQVESVLAHSAVQAVALTGSGPAGASVASTAGQHIKKSVLELGGSDPFIVMPSANIDEAVATGVKARLLNGGQSCIAAKRFILLEAIADEFLDKLSAAFQALTVGDPQLTETDIGPLANDAILKTLEAQVKQAIDAGATALVGGQRDEQRVGTFYPPTILINLPQDSSIAQEEFFGPVALVFRVQTLEEAITLANATEFGLGASAWTEDEAERDRLIRDIEAGSVFINGMVKSDPRLPFGGIKTSGYGRELSTIGIHEFVNIKTIWVK